MTKIRIRNPIRIFGWLWTVLGLTFALSVNAQQIDRVEVLPLPNGEAQIVVRTFPTLVYQRHVPTTETDTIRIYFLSTGGKQNESTLPRETWASPPSELVPRFEITYPEPDGAMVIRFKADVTAKVRQGKDNHELVILVPARKRDETKSSAPAEGVAQPLPAQPSTPKVYKSVEPKIPNLPDQREPDQTAAASSAPSSAAPVGTAPSAQSVTPSGVPVEPIPLDKVEGAAKDFLSQAETAIGKNDLATAANLLNQVLNLPANASSPQAQELIGVVREKSGDLDKARAEYDLFLRLYPSDPAAPRVKERLAKLPERGSVAMGAPTTVEQGGRRVMEAVPWRFTGGVSQNFYTGNSRIDQTTFSAATLDFVRQPTLSQTDQRALVTSVDLNAYKRTETAEHRVVFRDTYSANFLAGQLDTERVSTAYYEFNNRSLGLQGRFGRQSGNFGLMGQFDGVSGGYQIRNDLRVNAALGEPTLYSNRFTPLWSLTHSLLSGNELQPITNSTIKQRVYGVNLEYLGKPESVGGSVYFSGQTSDGYVDRQAVGLELRYFDSKRSVYSVLDYDVAIKGLNIATVQGNLTTEDGANYYLLFDHRRAPMLLLSSAVQYATAPVSGLPASNIESAIQNLQASPFYSGFSIADLRRWVLDTSAWSNVISGGTTRPINPKWQIGVDFSASQMKSSKGILNADGNLVGNQSGSSPTKSMSANLIGQSIFREGDTFVNNLNVISAPTYKGKSLGLNYALNFSELLRLDTALRWYRQTDTTDTKTDRINPTVRLNYRFRTNLSFDAEIGAERSRQTSGDGSTLDTDRKYLYLGYRWDLQ